MNSIDIVRAVDVLKNGGVIAYPTEAVFGLGCDPLNEKAVHRILSIKQRSIEKGLILIAADSLQIMPYVETLEPHILATWPGPVTWVLKKTEKLPAWISGQHDTVAVRVSKHPIVKELCLSFGHPIVSTSANRSNQAPLRNYSEVVTELGEEVDFVMPGETSHLLKPTEIRDGVTGKVIREG